jgi:acyl dehydratase
MVCQVRFSKPAFPGETFVTSMWDLGGGRVQFRTSVKERGVVVLDAGVAEFGPPDAAPDARSKL